MQDAQLLEQLNGKMHDVFDVLFVAAVIFYERRERITEHVGKRSFERKGHGGVHHDPLAQAAAADRERLNAQIIGKRFYDRHRRGHNVGTVGRQTADAFALFHVEHAHHVVNGFEIFDAERVIMHDIERIFAHEAVDLVKVAERSAHADHLRIGIDRFEPIDLLELLGEELFDPRRLLLGRNAVARKKIGQRHRAERKRCVVQNIAAIVINNFRAAAADFENNALGRIHGVDHAAVDERRFVAFRKHAHADAASRLYFVEKRTLVFRAANRRRRHRGDIVHPARVAQPAEHFKRFNGFRNALRLQKTVSVHVLSEADALFDFILDHVIAVAEQPYDDEPRRIRA